MQVGEEEVVMKMVEFPQTGQKKGGGSGGA